MITVIGLGFVGLTTALGFSEKGFKVYGYDIDNNKAGRLRRGEVFFHEPHLEGMLKRNLNNTFFIADDLKDAIRDSKAVFFCVGTPSKADGSCDTDYLLKAIGGTLVHVDSFKVFVVKSTVPPTTTAEQIKRSIEEKGYIIGKDVGLANNPEFLREGHSWEDFINPDRIVLGVEDGKSAEVLEEIYKPFNCPIHKVSYNTGEFVKYLSNTLLATLISFSNDMSMAAYKIGGIDISNAFKILHQDKRFSGNPANISSYVYPGCGFGGYCLPKDTSAICSLSAKKGHEVRILESALWINRRIRGFLIGQIRKGIGKNETIGVLGLSFKPDSDDVRDSPAKEIIPMLEPITENRIIAYDPLAMEPFKSSYGLDIEYAAGFEELVERSDHIIILTAWKEFKDKKKLFKGKKVYDFRYCL
ncbi:nucleotide sugar dehydrogenase [Candidatus Woesearchaeota archaeon]|nr:nucleotide sugar dehydrogenase [Candidatus Woesearchaeota archaeon]